MKIWVVAFNDGGWYSGPRPNFTVVSESKQEAIDKVLEEEALQLAYMNTLAVLYQQSEVIQSKAS